MSVNNCNSSSTLDDQVNNLRKQRNAPTQLKQLHFDIAHEYLKDSEQLRRRSTLSFTTVEVDAVPAHDSNSTHTAHDIATEYSTRREKIEVGQLSRWLTDVKEVVNVPPISGKARPKLRLLVYNWKDTVDAPWSDEDMCSEMIYGLNLPFDLPWLWYKLEHPCNFMTFSPAGMDSTAFGFGQLVLNTIYAKESTKYNLALAYNQESDSVTGMLCLSKRRNIVVDNVIRLTNYANNPLLIPLLIADELVMKGRERMDWSIRNIVAIEDMMAKIGNQEPNASGSRDIDCNELEVLDGDMNRMSRTLRNGEISLNMEYCRELFEVIKSTAEVRPKDMLTAELVEDVRAKFSQMRNVAVKSDKLENRLNFQTMMIYNILQRETTAQARSDTAIALRDSSQMKSVAVLTMVFLPTAALGTIFSMQPLFNEDEAGNVTISKEFWLFWAVCIPLTIFVLLIYVSWIERKEIAKILANLDVGRYWKPEKGFKKLDNETKNEIAKDSEEEHHADKCSSENGKVKKPFTDIAEKMKIKTHQLRHHLHKKTSNKGDNTIFHIENELEMQDVKP